MKYVFPVLVATLLALSAQPVRAEDPASTIDAVQKRYESTRTFRARFVQKSYLKIMGQTQEAQGEVLIQKPGMMKWDYAAPDRQILISNQEALWLYLPEEKQATRMKIDDVYSSNTPALFLAGKGRLTEAFNVGQVLDKGATLQLVLFPKDAAHNVDHLDLIVDKKNYQILGSSVYDKLGNKTEMHFSEIEINPEISEDAFRFQAPRGVEVIDYTRPASGTGPRKK